MAPCGYTGRAGKEGESSTLYVAVIFYGLSRIMLERESALPTIQDVPEIFDILSCKEYLRGAHFLWHPLKTWSLNKIYIIRKV